MKRAISLVLTLINLVVFFTLATTVSVSAATSASLTGPSVVRAGDTVTLTYKVSANKGKILGSSGEFNYDRNQVTLSSVSENVPGTWLLERNGNIFSAYDNRAENPITTNGYSLFTAKFKVDSGVKTGDTIKVSITNTKTSDGDNSTELGTVSYSVKIAAPKSSNNNLRSMTVSNATLSPSFGKSTTSYSATVPFSVSKLDIKTTVEDSSAEVSVSGNSLRVGSNTVTLTVTAENGAEKKYQIKVTRQQDPNYKASAEASLKNISVNKSMLSPAFGEDVSKYVVYLPNEVKEIAVEGSPTDSKASVEVSGGKDLKEGSNLVKITCTAEDGTTKKEYEITAVRMPEYEGGNIVIPGVATPEPSVTPTQTPTATPKPTATQYVPGPSKPANSISVWVVILFCVLSAGLGVLIGWIIFVKYKKGRKRNY